MTLREIFNSILDYPLELGHEFQPWAVVAGVVFAVAVWGFLYWRYER